MRISDWSSDVCSSDLKPQGPKFQHDLAIKALVEIGACHARQKLVLRIVASRVTDHSLLLRELLVQPRSEEHTSELQSLMRISYAVFCLKKKKQVIHSIN